MSRPRRHEDEQLKTSTYRISKRHKFLLRLLARQTSRDDGPTIEHALEQLAAHTRMSRNWVDLWDDEECVRMLRLFAMSDYKPSPPEQKQKLFVLAHARYFWAPNGEPHRARAIVLWPYLKELDQLWTETKHQDYKAAERRIVEILKQAQLDPPAD